MVMVYVPAGTFTMGSNDGSSDEHPVHEVTLSEFWIDRTEVTNEQYERCVADEESECTASTYANDSRFNAADRPVVGVSWHDANAYCTWVGNELPTEAQWEYAARGMDGRLYPWGDDPPTADLLNYSGSGIDRTTAVGSYLDGASPFGALDMAGNVWEWVADWYGGYSAEAAENPAGPDNGDYKVLRGGGWVSGAANVRAAFRFIVDPGYRDSGIGFRCAAGPGV